MILIFFISTTTVVAAVVIKQIFKACTFNILVTGF